MALGQRPLRTKELTARVSEFSPRSVYRCVDRLEDGGLVEHVAGPGVPSRALLSLTEPAGRNLVRLLRALTARSRMAAGDGLSWESLCLLGDLWELGFAAELSRGPRSLLELLDAAEGFTYHQVRRRTAHLHEVGLLEGRIHNGNGRQYELSERGRRCMAAIAGVGRWRHRSFLAEGGPGLEVEELATVLRNTLPLVRLPQHSGKEIGLAVSGAEEEAGGPESAVVHAAVSPAGALEVRAGAGEAADGSAAATTNTWFAALLDGNRGRIRVRGDLGLVDACLKQLYDALWEPAPA